MAPLIKNNIRNIINHKIAITGNRKVRLLLGENECVYMHRFCTWSNNGFEQLWCL